MRPIKLIMQAFGAYPNRVEIPFERLGSGNVYLISGATGSGKTTIFDAICFSLFNTSSGLNRGSETFRSHFAKESDESFVEFEFLFNGDIYKINRTPFYTRNKLKGEGITTQKARAMLTLPDGKIIVGVSEVDNYIEQLLNLNSQRFSQIALLAQGEFLKLLNSDTQTRGDIFREIFKTTDYSLFQFKLAEKAKEMKVLYDKTDDIIYHNLSDIECKDIELEELKEKICQGRCYELLDEFIDKLKLQNKNDKINSKEYQKQLDNTNLKIIELEKYLDKAKLKISLIDKSKDIDEKIKLKSVDFELSKKDYLTLDNKKLELDNLKLKLKKSDDDYNKATEIKKLEKELQKETLEGQNLAILKKDIDIKIDELKYNYLCCLNYELDNIKDDLSNEQNKLNNLKKDYDIQNKEYIDLRNNYLNHQAGILAQALSDNSPCPVCGSKEHPNPAKLSCDVISKEELDKLKDNLEKLNKSLSDTAICCNTKNEKLKNQSELFENMKNKFAIEKEIVKKSQKINYEEQNKKLENNKNELLGEIEKNNLELAKITANLETLKKDLNELDIKKISDEHSALSLEVEKSAKLILTIEKKYEEDNINLNKLTSQKTLLNQQIEELKEYEINLDEKLSELDLNKENLAKLNQELRCCISRKTINEKKIQIIEDEFKNHKNQKDEYLTLKTLSDCACGQLKGKAKIAFEQYIQAYYLDIVLFEANKRLKIMSKGQFQLQRKKDGAKKTSKTGLDIEVMDFHTFKLRDTKTLSGGESFMAALSLALGLSDSVSNLSGAVNIESLFIDEGFGTLDTEALELALDVIISLSSSNRLVGVISHVDELKSRIQNKILTHKTNNGSYCEINF